MKPQLDARQKQIVFLYLLQFNFGEAGDAKYDELENKVDELLKSMGYPTDIIFDNEGGPMINWASYGFPKGFDWEDEVTSEENGDFDTAEPYNSLLREFFEAESVPSLTSMLNDKRLN